MTTYDLAARLKEFREAVGLTPEQLDARVNAPMGTVRRIESRGDKSVDASLVALLARFLGVFGSALDSRFDTRLNDAAATFADRALALALDPAATKRIWTRAFGVSGYRGAIPDDIWDEHFGDEGGQKGLDL